MFDPIILTNAYYSFASLAYRTMHWSVVAANESE